MLSDRDRRTLNDIESSLQQHDPSFVELFTARTFPATVSRGGGLLTASIVALFVFTILLFGYGIRYRVGYGCPAVSHDRAPRPACDAACKTGCISGFGVAER